MAITFLAAALLSVAPTSSTAAAPRFSLSSATAKPGDHLVVRATSVVKRVRVYLVATEFGRNGLARSDQRLHQVATLTRGRRTARFLVPSLARGSYALAYCGCANGPYVRVARAPLLNVETPPEPARCPATQPNHAAPAGAPPYSFHGNREIAALVPADGTLRTSESDGTLFDKMLWIAAAGNNSLRVSYRRLDVQAPAIGAVTVAGTLSGYAGPSWASRLYLDRGCWEIRGSVASATLSVVLRVVAS
jgi:hypothetical protein